MGSCCCFLQLPVGKIAWPETPGGFIIRLKDCSPLGPGASAAVAVASSEIYFSSSPAASSKIHFSSAAAVFFWQMVLRWGIRGAEPSGTVPTLAPAIFTASADAWVESAEL